MYELKRIPMRDRPLPLMLLAIAGLLLALKLAWMHYDSHVHLEFHKSFCDINATFDCSYVVSSRWSELWPGLPIAAVAAGVFLALFALHTVVGQIWPDASRAIAFLLSMLSVLAAGGYLLVMVMVVKHGCLFCLLLDAVILGTAAIYIWNFKRWKIFQAVRPGALLGVSTVVFLCIVGMVATQQFFFDRAVQRLLKLSVDERIAEIQSPLNPETMLPFDHSDPQHITLYAFTDIQCQACRQGYTTLDKLRQIYGDKLRIISKQYPMDMACNKTIRKSPHPGSCQAARVVLSARQAGRYEEVLAQIFATQSPAELNEVLNHLESDPKIHAGLANADATLQSDLADGATVAVAVTPTYFLNGRRIEGAQPFPVWTAVIDDLLAKADGLPTQH